MYLAEETVFWDHIKRIKEIKYFLELDSLRQFNSYKQSFKPKQFLKIEVRLLTVYKIETNTCKKSAETKN